MILFYTTHSRIFGPYHTVVVDTSITLFQLTPAKQPTVFLFHKSDDGKACNGNEQQPYEKLWRGNM